jgi:hypothetical protein
MKHKKKWIKSAKARVTGTIPYCHGKVPEYIECLCLIGRDVTFSAACDHVSAEVSCGLDVLCRFLGGAIEH